MTRRSSATKSKPKPTPTPAPAEPSEPLVRLKPRRGLFYLLLGIFILWIGFLVALYFTTVYHKTDVHEQIPPGHAVP